MNGKRQKGVSQLEAIIGLGLLAGVSGQVLVTGEQVQEAINEHNEQKCVEARQLVHQFPQLDFSERYYEVCNGNFDR
jgi:hypothetical protein